MEITGYKTLMKSALYKVVVFTECVAGAHVELKIGAQTDDVVVPVPETG